MTEYLLALVPQYGLWLLAAATLLASMLVPAPASILLLAAGGFVAAGDLSLLGCFAAAMIGGFLGDQALYFIARWRGPRIVAWLGKRAAPVAKASAALARRGGIAVFLSRWVIPATGAYMTLAAGASGLRWYRFTPWGLAGQAIWIGLYIGLGYVFTGNLEAASGMAVNILGFLAAGALALGLGFWLVLRLRANRKAAASGPGPDGVPTV